MSFHDYFHVLNPSSHWRDAVHSFVQKDPALKLQWVERTSHPTHLETILNWAMVEGQKKLCIWGGDGTLNRVLQFFSTREALDKVELALIPAGTCNDFFRKNHSADNEGIRQYFDLGLLVSENIKRVFLNNAGFGREPNAIRAKPKHPILDIFSLTKKTIHLEWMKDGKISKATTDVFLGIVCNSPFFNCGLAFDPSCDPKDSQLDGFFEISQNKLRLILKLCLGRIGKSLASGTTVSIKSSKISVTSDADLYPQVDGEAASVGAVRKILFDVQPKALALALYKRPF